MKITRGLADHKRAPHPVLTIGNFDGQHRGHLALLRAVVETAAARSGTPMALTFDPHPITVLAPSVDLRLLTSMEDKLARFQEAGIEEVLFLGFNTQFAALAPEEFVFQILRDGVGVKDLFVGEHFAFGKGRAGRMADLLRLGAEAGFQVHPVPPVRVDGEIVSSTRIRQLVQAGEMGRAARFLGRPYALSGQVVGGERRGHALGWPTANLRLPPNRVIPADGVYATMALWKTRSFDSVSYIGTRPTFGPGERLLEVYLLDTQLDLYGEELRVHFVERLRGDLAFHTAEELSARIDRDVTLAREMLRAASQTVTDA
ncbi:MAG: bifunctional riboflavin kinase/FAD synthetase [Nitrospirae bacterium]|nr:bifunctional riboflavin kinase/FAD synthetase [Nitrospirota bacterium]